MGFQDRLPEANKNFATADGLDTIQEHDDAYLLMVRQHCVRIARMHCIAIAGWYWIVVVLSKSG